VEVAAALAVSLAFRRQRPRDPDRSARASSSSSSSNRAHHRDRPAPAQQRHIRLTPAKPGALAVPSSLRRWAGAGSALAASASAPWSSVDCAPSYPEPGRAGRVSVSGARGAIP
jgi:hypothetical protein